MMTSDLRVKSTDGSITQYHDVEWEVEGDILCVKENGDCHTCFPLYTIIAYMHNLKHETQ